MGHENSWLQHPLACHKGIACWGPGQPPRPDDNKCKLEKVFNPILQQCLDSVANCTMTTVVPDGCRINPCQNGGGCITPNTRDKDFLCNCTANYIGTFCEIGILIILVDSIRVNNILLQIFYNHTMRYSMPILF